AADAPIDAAADGAVDDAVVASCTDDTQCGLSTLHCDRLSGDCVPCLVDSDCPGAHRRCDGALHRCVECGLSSDCAATSTCNPTTHTCVRLCDGDARNAC